MTDTIQNNQLNSVEIQALISALAHSTYATQINSIIVGINANEQSEIDAIKNFLNTPTPSFLDLTKKRLIVVSLVRIILSNK